MALKKPITGGTQYLYAFVKNIYYTKPDLSLGGNSHNVTVQIQVRDTADPALQQVEIEAQQFVVPITLKPDPANPLKQMVDVDPLDINALNTNMIAQAYVWLKANIALFADFTSV